MFCFSSPQPRLNNRRAINYIPNWIPICPFAMYGSKTFYLLCPFKVPQDPSIRERRGANGQAARNEGDLIFFLAVRGSEERSMTARGLQKSAFQGSTS